MRIAMWPIERVRPYDKNPRLNDDAVDAVARSIQEFGFRQPIVVDEEDTIIVGHTRWKAAQRLGMAKVPVHVAQDLTPAQIKAYRIADNQTANIATWDFDLLPLELADLQGMEFDLGRLGFDQDELARLLDPDLQDGQCDPDDVPAPPDEACRCVHQPRDRVRASREVAGGSHRLQHRAEARTDKPGRLREPGDAPEPGRLYRARPG